MIDLSDVVNHIRSLSDTSLHALKLFEPGHHTIFLTTEEWEAITADSPQLASMPEGLRRDFLNNQRLLGVTLIVSDRLPNDLR